MPTVKMAREIYDRVSPAEPEGASASSAAAADGKPMGLDDLLMKGIGAKRLSSIFKL